MTFDLAQMIADRDAGTPGEWFINGPTWNQIVWTDNETRMCFMAHSNGLCGGRDEANARRIARVPLLEAEIIRLTARVAELEGALKPLADMAERYDPDDGDDGQLECWSGLAVPKIHHLRTARAALSTPTEDQPK